MEFQINGIDVDEYIKNVIRNAWINGFMAGFVGLAALETAVVIIIVVASTL